MPSSPVQHPYPPESFINRELSWLNFAERVLTLAEDPELPLLERVKFTGIMGMLHDEFFMKRISGLKRQMTRSSNKKSIDGRRPAEEFAACRKVLLRQCKRLSALVRDDLRPALVESGIGILDYESLDDDEQAHVTRYFESSVQPILTPLAVDAEHPFPFISSGGINLAVLLPDAKSRRERFVRIKVPDNRPRWVSLPGGNRVVPLEQVIAANITEVIPESSPENVFLFRVIRGAEGEVERGGDLDETLLGPGSIVRQVTNELKARRFAGLVRLQVDNAMPKKVQQWLAAQLGVEKSDIYGHTELLGLSDLLKLSPQKKGQLRFPEHEPVTHPRLQELPPEAGAIFDEIRRGDILLHHPYDSFDSSVLRFLQSAAVDPATLAIKLTIYRTSKDSPIVAALAEAARRGKQVAVLVEITARFDEAPNIAWGEFLEREGVHVAYGVESLKTHVKLAMVVREEDGGIRRYLHAGTGNYHTGTARIYEDIGVLTCQPELCEEAAAVFNSLTGATGYEEYRKMLVAPVNLRERFVAMIRREAEHAREGRPAGILAKMNQLQDPEIIRELYAASSAGVPIQLIVRGLCCLRPGVAELSETIGVRSVVGRFLEHSRIYRFENAGTPEFYIGSADWMKRNLDRRVETVVPILDPANRERLDQILNTYLEDNHSAWICGSDGSYERQQPADGEAPRGSQETFLELAEERRAIATAPSSAGSLRAHDPAAAARRLLQRPEHGPDLTA